MSFYKATAIFRGRSRTFLVLAPTELAAKRTVLIHRAMMQRTQVR